METRFPPICRFAYGIGGVFRNAQAEQPGDSFRFLLQLPDVRINKVRVRQYPLGVAKLVNGGIPVGEVFPQGGKEQ